MINLLRAETTRFTGRRMVWIGFAIALLVAVGILVLMSFETREPTAAQIAQGQQYYQQAHQDWQNNHAEYEKQCQQNAPEGTDCSMPEPQPSDFARQAASFDDAGTVVTLAGTAVFGLAAMFVAASLVGADFSSGAMANWLSFIPVRWRVYVSRLVVAVVATTAMTAVLMALLLGALAVVVTIQQPGPLHGWPAVIGMAARGLALVALAALLGFTVSFLTRRTIATVGAVFAYLVVRLVLGAFQMQTWFGTLQPALPDNNALALLNKDLHYSIYHQVVSSHGVDYNATDKVLHWEQGLAYLLVGAAVLVAISLASFLRRDVT